MLGPRLTSTTPTNVIARPRCATRSIYKRQLHDNVKFWTRIQMSWTRLLFSSLNINLVNNDNDHDWTFKQWMMKDVKYNVNIVPFSWFFKVRQGTTKKDLLQIHSKKKLINSKNIITLYMHIVLISNYLINVTSKYKYELFSFLFLRLYIIW